MIYFQFFKECDLIKLKILKKTDLMTTTLIYLINKTMSDYFDKTKKFFNDTKNKNNILDNVSSKVSDNATYYKNRLNSFDYTPYKNKISETYKDLSEKTEKELPKIKKTVSDLNNSVVDNVKHIHKTASSPENVKIMKDALLKSRDKMNTASNVVFGFYKSARYSMIAVGVGVLLFGTGYVLRPVADIYSSSKNTKNKIE